MKHSTIKLFCFIGFVMACSFSKLQAQDTVHITLPQAEQIFLQQNLQLLAEHYNIDIAKAGEIQAKLYNNPTLTLAGSLYDPVRNKVFNVSNRNGQYDVAIQQLVRLAGKRNKEIRLAEANTAISESRFFDLLRTLRYTLRSTFYELYYMQRSINAYQLQIASLEKLSNAYDVLEAKAVVTTKDALRIKALLYSLKTEQASLLVQLSDLQASLQLLLRNNNAVYVAGITSDDNLASKYLQQSGLQSLIDTAYANRADLKLAQNSLLYSRQNYILQKSMATPDLTIGGEFDKRGSFVDNATFLTVSMDLPFFKRNQGNIKAAKISIDQGNVIVQQQQQSIENDVQRAYSKWLAANNMLSSIDPSFEQQFEKLMQGMTENFQKKNISLVEFTDFYESYRNNVLQLNSLKDAQAQALEALQFALGKTIINN